MGENLSQRPSLVSLPNFLLLMLVAGGVYFYRPPLRSTRPVSTGSVQSTKAMRLNKQSAEYHIALVPLSQDPFLVADEVLESTAIAATVVPALSVFSAPFWKPETKSADAIRVIFFMTPTGHAAERVEHRLRARQAALGALRSEGFTPVHPGNIFHLALDPSQWTRQLFSAPYQFSPKSAAVPAETNGTPPHFRLTSVRSAAELKLMPRPTPSSASHGYTMLGQDERAADSFIAGSQDAVIFPYEWFAQDVVAARAGHVNSISHVLVIWMPEGKFGSENLAVLRTITASLRLRLLNNDSSMTVPAPAVAPPPPTPPMPSASTATPSVFPVSLSATNRTSHRVVATSTAAPPDLPQAVDPSPSFALVGPTSSTTLRAMLEESTQSRPANGETDLIKLLRVYAPSPSAEPFLMTSLDPSKAGESLGTIDETFAKRLPFSVFERVCQTDDVIAQALADELRMRGLHIVPTSSEWKIAQANDDGNLLDNIALVCEHESLYGRAFPQTFNAILWHIAEGDGKTYRERNADWRTKHSSRPPNIHVYFYPQGVDALSSQTDAARKSEERSNAPSATGPRLPELPEGPGQLDYIRRLAQSLSSEYRRAGRNRLRAVGIIGTDVYDKMLLLQALRAEFPDILC